MSKVILFNAPASAGKDCGAEYIEKKYNAQHLRFKDQLYKIAAINAGIPTETMKRVATDRNLKEVPCTMFRLGDQWISPRQWLIHTSENIVKPLAGKNYFGKALSDSITSDLVVASDSGFMEEVVPLVEQGHDVYVLRIVRDGFTFEGDSRRYLEPTHFYKTILVENNKSIESYYNRLDSIVCDILGISGVSSNGAI